VWNDSSVPAKDIERRRATARAWYRRMRSQVTRVPRPAAQVARQTTLAAWYGELKTKLACIRCGESHPACIVFHHADAKVKELTISDAVRRGCSRARIEREIEKCEVLCANCHAKHHAQERP
jgi:hypothetical protein